MPSYASRWRVRRIDADTWLPSGEIGGMRSVTVRKSANYDSTPLMESGDVESTGRLAEGYHRIEMLSSTGELAEVATLLLVPDGSTWSHEKWNGRAVGKSVLSPAAERKLKPGAYAAMGDDGAAWAARTLSGVIDAPVRVVGSFSLGEHVVFDLGASYLDAVWKVLDVGGFCMQVSGDGTVTVCPKPGEPALVVNAATRSLLMPEIGSGLPVDDVPNVLKVYDDKGVEHVARNDDPSSPTSTVSRGREIDCVEDSPTREEDESWDDYASRRLSELSEIYETYDVEREHVPGVLPYSLVRVNLPEQGMSGDYRVMSQTIECGKGITVSETWGRLANGRD